jgi:hypothetical protein
MRNEVSRSLHDATSANRTPKGKGASSPQEVVRKPPVVASVPHAQARMKKKKE